MFNNGNSKELIAEELCVSTKSVYTYLVSKGLITPKKRMSESKRQRILSLREKGETYDNIVKLLGVPKTTVARVIKAKGSGNGTSDSVATADSNANNLNKN